MRLFSLTLVVLCAALGLAAFRAPADKVVKTPAEWKRVLSAEAFHILRESGTETPYTGKYWDHHETGIYACAGCGQKLFSSKHKFESHTGWPSFFKTIEPKSAADVVDRSDGMVRTEVRCARCDGHLGHVFQDGPKPTGLRYCINSPALKFVKAAK